ncbi:MAG: zinc ABC transporter substrate-binding protein [Clostridia bacterium]|nr:zinc ABC transporter substrate-binding protein [Clostridia bacterium]
MFKSVQKPILTVLFLLLGLILLLAGGCAKQEKQSVSSDNGKIICVAVSIVPQASFVEAVGGDQVDVITMIPKGANPENFAPDPKQMAALSEAQIYFTIGVPAEVNGILPRIEKLNSDMKILDLAAKADQVYPARELAPGEKDPHRWMSPKRVVVMIESIAEELAAADPNHADQYQKNAEAYIAQLEKLDEDITASLSAANGKSFIVYHPAMGYFADDYGLTMIALEEEGKEATAQGIQAVVDQAKKENIKVVFYQAEMDSKQAQTIAQELGGEAELIAPLAPGYIDNLRKTAQIFARVLK